MTSSSQKPAHPWKARMIIGLLMMVFAFLGLMITDLWQAHSWDYWRIMVPIFASMCLWLSWYVKRKGSTITFITIWHELLHWTGLVLAVIIFSVFVDSGIMGRMQAALGVLTLLALATFLAGVYIEFSFILIGLMMGFFAYGAAMLEAYLYSVMLPIALLGIVAIVYLSYGKRHHPTRSSKEPVTHLPEEKPPEQ